MIYWIREEFLWRAKEMKKPCEFWIKLIKSSFRPAPNYIKIEIKLRDKDNA